LPRRQSNGRWLAGYLIRIGVGIILVLILWQFLPGLLEDAFRPSLTP